MFQLNIDLYNTLQENPDAFKMYMECIKKLEKSKGSLQSILGTRQSSKSKSLGTSRRSSKRSSKRSSRRGHSRSHSHKRNSGRHSRKHSSGRARGNSDENCDEDTLCSVCFNNVTPQETRMSHIAGRACKHLFHKNCLDGWWNTDASKRNTCPKCNVPIPVNAWTIERSTLQFTREDQDAFNAEFPRGLAHISRRRLQALAEYIVDHEHNLRMNPVDTQLHELLTNEFRNTEIGDRFQEAIIFHRNTRIIENNAREKYINVIVFVLFFIILSRFT